jgi:ABC-type lipoprotein export system ATPase subunit
MPRGETLFLVGPSGCGKTTLLSILGCILAADRSRVELRGAAFSLLRHPACTRDHVFKAKTQIPPALPSAERQLPR